MIIKRGYVIFAESEFKSGQFEGLRPYLVVSNNTINKFSAYVTVAAITTKIQESQVPTHIKLPKEFGFHADSILLCEKILTIDKTKIDNFKVTELNVETMVLVDKALLFYFGLESDTK